MPQDSAQARRPTLRLRLMLSFVGVLTVPTLIALLVTSAPFRTELLIFGLVVLLGMGAAAFVALMLARPIEQVAEAARRAAAGDLRAPLPTAAPDEVGSLARSLAEIRHSLARADATVATSRDEVRESVRRLGEALRSTHDLMKMLSVVLETALVAVQGKAGAVYLMSSRRSELMIKVGRNLDRSIAERRIGVGQGLAGWVAKNKRGVRLPGTAGDAPVPIDPEPVEQTALAVPLETQSQLLGVLAVYGRATPEPFRDEDLEAIESLARQAGVGIENVLLHQEAERLSITDGLTGIWNYRHFQLQLAREFAGAMRFNRELTLLVIDIDHFKSVNDQHGHQRGDAVLIEIARRILTHTRGNVDTLARYGGEEFVLILPETGIDGARTVAEKIRAEVAATPFGDPGEAPLEVSVSIGFASYPAHGLTPQLLLHAADQAMYEAKARGRNRIVGAEETAGSALAHDPARP